jgi:hypothetical protein
MLAALPEVGKCVNLEELRRLDRLSLDDFEKERMQMADDARGQTNFLFKIVTAKDEIVVGLAGEDIRKIGGADVTAIGQALARSGELTLMRFAVRKAPDGELEQAPLHRVSILAHDSLRIEPYPTPLRIVPIA